MPQGDGSFEKGWQRGAKKHTSSHDSPPCIKNPFPTARGSLSLSSRPHDQTRRATSAAAVLALAPGHLYPSPILPLEPPEHQNTRTPEHQKSSIQRRGNSATHAPTCHPRPQLIRDAIVGSERTSARASSHYGLVRRIRTSNGLHLAENGPSKNTTRRAQRGDGGMCVV